MQAKELYKWTEETDIGEILHSVIVMDYEKRSLQDLIDNDDVLTNDKILKILGQFSEAMSFIYLKLKISHSDLKPANIMIDKDFNIKINPEMFYKLRNMDDLEINL